MADGEQLHQFVEGLLARGRRYGQLRSPNGRPLTRRFRLSRRWSWALELHQREWWLGAAWRNVPRLVDGRHPAFGCVRPATVGLVELPAQLDVTIGLLPVLRVVLTRLPR